MRTNLWREKTPCFDARVGNPFCCHSAAETFNSADEEQSWRQNVNHATARERLIVQSAKEKVNTGLIRLLLRRNARTAAAQEYSNALCARERERFKS